MECPSCHANRISLGAKLFVAARMSIECPSCGATLRFQRLPRLVHALVGDGMLLLGAAGAFMLQAPMLLLISGGVWSVLALTLPLSATHPVPNQPSHEDTPSEKPDAER